MGLSKFLCLLNVGDENPFIDQDQDSNEEEINSKESLFIIYFIVKMWLSIVAVMSIYLCQ